MIQPLSEQDKLYLSPEEIAALEEDDEGLDDLKTEEALKVEVEAEAAAKEKADAEAKEEAEAAATAEAEKKTEPPPFVPQIQVVSDEELADLKQKYEIAQDEYDDGDIEYSELDKVKDPYNQAKWEKDYSEKSNASMHEARWTWEQKRFLDDNADFRNVSALNAAFVAAVNKLISTDDGKTMSDRQVLEAAKESVEKDLGATTRGRSMDTADISDEAVSGKSADFSYLDKLEGAAYQAAIDKLTPEQLERLEDLQ